MIFEPRSAAIIRSGKIKAERRYCYPDQIKQCDSNNTCPGKEQKILKLNQPEHLQKRLIMPFLDNYVVVKIVSLEIIY
jgi:hypothetical protein